jgi:hypothetical protein
MLKIYYLFSRCINYIKEEIMKYIKESKVLILVFYLLIFGNTLAQENIIPTMINYQGFLTDENGSALTGSYQITFRLYDEASGDNPWVWSEMHDAVVVENGLFNVLLGSIDTLSADDLAGERYLGIMVAGEVEMTPRMRLASVAYSLQSERAFKLNAPDGDPVDAVHVDNDGKVGIGMTNPGEVLDVAGNVRASSFIYADNTSAQWKRIAEVPLNGAFYHFVNIDRSNAKAYKILFSGNVNSAGTDSRFLIRINGSGQNYASSWFMRGKYDEDADFTDGLYIIRAAWLPPTSAVGFEYTLQVMDSQSSGISVIGHGMAVTYNYTNFNHVFATSGGVWKTENTPISSIWVGTHNSKVMTGQLVLYVLE